MWYSIENVYSHFLSLRWNWFYIFLKLSGVTFCQVLLPKRSHVHSIFEYVLWFFENEDEGYQRLLSLKLITSMLFANLNERNACKICFHRKLFCYCRWHPNKLFPEIDIKIMLAIITVLNLMVMMDDMQMSAGDNIFWVIPSWYLYWHQI